MGLGRQKTSDAQHLFWLVSWNLKEKFSGDGQRVKWMFGKIVSCSSTQRFFLNKIFLHFLAETDFASCGRAQMNLSSEGAAISEYDTPSSVSSSSSSQQHSLQYYRHSPHPQAMTSQGHAVMTPQPQQPLTPQQQSQYYPHHAGGGSGGAIFEEGSSSQYIDDTSVSIAMWFKPPVYLAYRRRNRLHVIRRIGFLNDFL